MDRVVVLLVERHLEGQDAQKAVDVALDVLYAVLLPCPYLGRDVVEDRDVCVLLDVACYLQVEAGIVDEDERVGLPGEDVLATTLHAPHDGGQVHEYGQEAHVGKVAVVLHQLSPLSRHHVAAEASEAGLGVFVPERCHQSAGM